VKKINILYKKDLLFGSFEAPNKYFALVIFAHGLLSGVEESQRFSFAKKIFHKNKIATLGTYFPGHGPRKNEKFSIKKSIKTMEKTIDYVPRISRPVPVFLLGISTGSSIALCMKRSYFKKIWGMVLFSLILDLGVFKNFKFNWKHYHRWKTYGYSDKTAETMFRNLSEESIRNDYCLKISNVLKKVAIPKLVIHGKNDRVNSFKEIIGCVDDKTTLAIYPGIEGGHDISGFCLECAANQASFWIANMAKNSN